MKQILILILLFTLLALMIACDLGTSSGPSGTGPNPIVRPLANAEAEMAAVWLSGELTAPQNLYKRIRDDLSEIRSVWGDTIGVVDSIYYYPYSEIGMITIIFYDSAFEHVLAGNYTGWDSLNTALNIDSIHIESRLSFARLYFKGRLNSVLLVDLYAGLPGAKSIETNSRVGDGPTLVMLQEGNEVKYFFRNAWGDCLAGCINSHIAYLTSRGDSIRFVGEFGNDSGNTLVDPPIWMDTFHIAYENWQQWNQWQDTVDHNISSCDSLFDIPDLSEYMPHSNEEAEIAALVLSEELVAPPDLTRRIEHDLRSFRAIYSDSIREVKIPYRSPWQASRFTFKFERGLLTDSLHPGFELFNCLNEELRMNGILAYFASEWHDIKFEGRLNSNRLAEMYSHVPGIKYIYVSGFVGDGPDIYITGDSTEMKYFFRDAWGDCPAGCMYQEYYYFNSNDGFYRFIGSWNPITEIVPPVWADTVYMARAQKFQYFQWSASDSVASYNEENWNNR